MDRYVYLVWALIFLAVWAFLYWFRKDTRKEMLFVSVLFGFGGLISEHTYIQDWWKPLTVTNTSIGLEDFLIGFAIGGVAAVIYEDVYKQRLVHRSRLGGVAWNPGFFLFLFPALYLTLFFVVGLSSFYATIVGLLACIAVMLIARPDLVRDSLGSGIFTLLVGVTVYAILIIAYPPLFSQFWYLDERWYTQLLLGIPLYEYVWFFLVGAYIGPLYEYVSNFSFRRMK